MIYTVIIQPTAEADMESAYQFIRADSKIAVDRWLIGLIDAINSLAQMPNRCGLAHETREFKEQIRQFIYGRRHHAHRIIFIVRADQVRVLRILHGSRDELDPKELMP